MVEADVTHGGGGCDVGDAVADEVEADASDARGFHVGEFGGGGVAIDDGDAAGLSAGIDADGVQRAAIVGAVGAGLDDDGSRNAKGGEDGAVRRVGSRRRIISPKCGRRISVRITKDMHVTVGGIDRDGHAGLPVGKVFCFFFSKKKRLLALIVSGRCAALTRPTFR